MCQYIQSIGQFLNRVLVPGYVGAQVPLPVFILDRRTIYIQLNTFVGQLTDIHQHAFRTHRSSRCHIQNLVFDRIGVEVELHAQSVIEEFVFDTQFKFIFGFRLNIFISDGSCQILIGKSIVTEQRTLAICQIGSIDFRSVTYNTI